VIASPVTMAGKYNRSRQLSFGRETVIAMVKMTKDECQMTN
jgi:hypothetical protein